MPKIENDFLYPLENDPKLTDKVIGTDVGTNATKNFNLQSIADFLGRLNNNQFTYYGLITPDINYFTAGAFFTNTNFNVANSFSRLIINKSSNQSQNISDYLIKLSTISNIYLKLANNNNINNFFIFKVNAIIDQIDYFFIDVTISNNLSLGSLNNSQSYNFIFSLESLLIIENLPELP